MYPSKLKFYNVKQICQRQGRQNRTKPLRDQVNKRSEVILDLPAKIKTGKNGLQFFLIPFSGLQLIKPEKIVGESLSSRKAHSKQRGSNGNGATRPLPRDEGAEKLRGNGTVGSNPMV